MAYAAFGGLDWVQAVFYGVGAAVIGLIANSAYGLVRRTLARIVSCGALLSSWL